MYGFGGVGQLEVRFRRVLPWRDNRTTEQGKIGLLSQWTMEGSDEQKRYHQNSEREEPGGKAKASSYSLSKTVSIFALLGLGLSTYILWMVQHVVCVGVQCTHIC